MKLEIGSTTWAMESQKWIKVLASADWVFLQLFSKGRVYKIHQRFYICSIERWESKMTVQVKNKAPIWDESYYNSERKNYKLFGALNKSEFP